MPYDWYEEDFAAFLWKNNLPTYNRDFEIKEFYHKAAKAFMDDYAEMLAAENNRSHPAAFYEALEAATPDIAKRFTQIEQVLVLHDKSDFKAAQEVFDALMGEMINDLLLRPINGMEQLLPKLYRVRSVNSTTETLDLPSDLFHIPFNKRQLITNERYSLAGHPCLYLATRLGIAWQECDYPSKFFYSEYQYQYCLEPGTGKIDFEKEWRFITFLSPRRVAQDFLVAINAEHNAFRQAFLSKYVKVYPLLLACSIVNLSGDSTFKPEFIIPQMLLQWVRRNISIARGITYFSCLDNDDLRQINGYNVVIPAVRFNKKGYCLDLTGKFKISKPIYCDNLLERSKHEQITAFKKDVLENISNFTFEAHQCITDMYEVTTYFDNLILRAEKTDMKLVVQTLLSIRMNCSYIRNHHKKDKIIEKARATARREDEDTRIALFEQYYDRFFADVESVISQYEYEIEKITADPATAFYKVR